MAASSESPVHDEGQTRRPAATSPLVAFKKFADEQFSALVHRAFGSNPFILHPSVSAEAFKSDYQSWIRECRESKGRLRPHGEDSIDGQPSKDLQTDSHSFGKCPESVSEREAADLCSFFDPESIAAPLPTLDVADVLESRLSDVSSESPATPLIYMMAGPYSPTYLENQWSEIYANGTPFRVAFEDLIRTASGLPMSTDPQSASRSVENPRRWAHMMIDLVSPRWQGRADSCRQDDENRLDAHPYLLSCLADFLCNPEPQNSTSLETDMSDDREASIHPLSSYAYASALRRLFVAADKLERRLNGEKRGETDYDVEKTRYERFEDDGDAETWHRESATTELDLVEQLEGNQEATSNRIAQRTQSSKTSPDATKASILSTLTTTEKTTLPDGTTTTRMVLKKRFADGREETTETLHTQNISKQAKDSVYNDCKSQAAQNRKGWFWR